MIDRGFDEARRLKANQTSVRQFAIEQAMKILQDAGVIDPELEFAKRINPEVPRIDLRQQTYELLNHIREPLTEEEGALRDKGFVLLPIDRKTYVQVVAEDQGYFLSSELKYANSRSALKDYVFPVAVRVGLNPTELAILGSFGKSRSRQLELIEEYSQLLQKDVPCARAIMFPATGYAQADRAYKAIIGEVLFRNYFASALDDLTGGFVARAGRRDPLRPFRVLGCNTRWGRSGIGAVPVVVFVGN